MKHLIIIMALLTSSCSTYQYNFDTSNKEKVKTYCEEKRKRDTVVIVGWSTLFVWFTYEFIKRMDD